MENTTGTAVSGRGIGRALPWALPVAALPLLVVLLDRAAVSAAVLAVAAGLAVLALAARPADAGEGPRLRGGLIGVVLCAAAAQAVVVLSGPGLLAWGVLRVAGYVLFLLVLSRLPSLRRHRTDWAALVMDGAVSVVAFVLLVVLGVGALPGADPAGTSWPPLLWAALLLPVAVPMAGGLFRSRTPVPILLLLTGLALAVTADIASAVAPGTPLAPALWTALLAGAALTARASGPFGDLTDWTGPRHLGLAQTVLVGGVVVVALRGVDGGGDVAVVAVALGTLLLQVLAEGRQNRRLFREIVEQAHLTAAQAETDRLTGLLNRPALLDRIEVRLRGGGQVQVIILDLDGFTALNESRGHVTGDALLRDVADRLRDVTAAEDVVARFSADEFAVLVGSDDLGAGHELAHGLIPAIAGPAASNADDQEVSASVGLVRARNVTAATVVHHAELALGRAKAAGGSQVQIFQPWMAEAAAGRRRMRALLSAAITAGDLRLALQPVVDARTGHWASFEALVRWQDEDQLRMPMEFVPLAEESGLIIPMGSWVLAEALRQIAAWPDREAGIAVNVTARQLEQPDFPQEVRDRLTETGVAPSRLTLEIAEQTAVRDLGRTASRLAPLRELGVHVALDDFGTGFSSLAYLAKLPCDILKIDQKFVQGMATEAEDEVLVRMMIRLGAELGLKVVAEGVETVEQAAALRELGCDFFQGYYYSRPRPVDELRATWARQQMPASRTDHDSDEASRMSRRDEARIDTAPPVHGM